MPYTQKYLPSVPVKQKCNPKSLQKYICQSISEQEEMKFEMKCVIIDNSKNVNVRVNRFK